MGHEPLRRSGDGNFSTQALLKLDWVCAQLPMVLPFPCTDAQLVCSQQQRQQTEVQAMVVGPAWAGRALVQAMRAVRKACV